MLLNRKDLVKIIGKALVFILSLILVIVGFKLALFYIPFLIAFILYLLIEPLIRLGMKKFNFKRKTCSLIILSVALGILIGLIAWGIVVIISEASNLLNNLNEYVAIIQRFINDKTSNLNFSKIQLPQEISSIINSSGQDFVNKISIIIQNILTNILEKITSIPTLAFYITITIMALYFFSTDKIYMIDQLEHHLPKNWVKQIAIHINGIGKALGNYLKAQAILIIVSFFISLVGLYIFYFLGFGIKYPLLVALGIGFVDALPILGSGTVMLPWAIIVSCKGNFTLGISILSLWVIMTIVRQVIEPKVVSGKLGIHPIFTLIAMYTGFKFCGIAGLFVGPISLIILKNIYENRIDKGIVKSILDE